MTTRTIIAVAVLATAATTAAAVEAVPRTWGLGWDEGLVLRRQLSPAWEIQLGAPVRRPVHAQQPFAVRSGDEFTAHQAELKKGVLDCVGLWPLPERVPLDVRQSPLDAIVIKAQPLVV